jgi:inosine-uridine nucleoside N-ribohydrolase
LAVLLALLSALANAEDTGKSPAREPARLIFDTDVGNDIDDAMALALIHALESQGQCKLLAVTVTKDNRYAAPFVDLVNTFYGRGDIPIGVVRGGVTPQDGHYLRSCSTAEDNRRLRYPHKLLDGRNAPEATGLLRKILAGQPDGSVTIVQVGFSTNLARLLASKPDKDSPLDGTALVRKKVRLLCPMAGDFRPMAAAQHVKEYNVATDVKSAQRVFDHWPTPIVVSGHEIGTAIHYPAKSIERDYGYVPHHPIAEAYRLYAKMPYDRSTYDLTSVLYAVLPEAGYFGLSAEGRLRVDQSGVMHFEPQADGLCRYMTVTPQQVARVRDAFVKLCSRAPDSQRFRRLPMKTYRDKMRGGWLGQMAGVGWGQPTEFTVMGAIIPEAKMPAWQPAWINQHGNDDCYVEMTFMKTLEDYGLNVGIRQAGIDFANSGYPLWHANDAGRTNLRKGIAPPDSGHPKFNQHADDIDYQIESDFAGIISPGMPNQAIALGSVFGHLMNYGDGVYAGQFIASMYAEGYFQSKPEKLIPIALRSIPAESQYAEMVRDMLRWHQEIPDDWQRTWQLVENKYHKDPKYTHGLCSKAGGAKAGSIDVKLNGAYVLMGLLYGGGDPDRTIVIACRCGQDSDCNPANAGGILFATMGAAKIPPRFLKELNLNAKYSHSEYTLPKVYEVSEKLTRAGLIKAGGRIEKDADGEEILVIPVQTPKPSKLERSWAPGPAANSRFTPEERAKIRFTKP